MRSSIACIFTVLSFVISCKNANTTTDGQAPMPLQKYPVPDVTLKTLNGKDTLLTGIAHKKALVLVFLSPECPLCKGYANTLTSLTKKYNNSNIAFCGVFPGKLYPIEEIRDFKKYFSPGCPLVLDTAFNLTRMLGATKTPEVFVLDANSEVVYSGRIDNWAYDVSKKRQNITEHNLEDVLTAIVNNTPISINKTEAVGCFIELPGK